MNNWIHKLNNSWWQMLVLVALLVTMNISIKTFTKNGFSGAEILLLRSSCNLLASFAIAAFTKTSIIPKQPKLQAGVFICLGLCLLLIFTAYQYISAGSVSILQRLDIPLFVILAAFNRKSSLFQIVMAILSFTLVASLIFFSKTTNENPVGYFIVLSAVVIICINTLLQKKIVLTENIPTIIFISSISSVFWSGIQCLHTHATFANIHTGSLLVIVGLSLINLIIFYIINDIYKKHNPEVVRYPYLVAAFFTMIVEMVIAEKLSSPILIIGNIFILIVLTILVRSREKGIVSNESNTIN